MQKQELPKSEQCPNCGHSVIEYKYCPECGQENIDYRVRLNVLIRYYASKYLRLDLKWIITLKILFIRPWYLTQVYLEGQRKKYTHPFRLCFVLSVLFFLGLRLQIVNQSDKKSMKVSFFSIQTENEVNMQKIATQTMAQLPNAMLISIPLVALTLTGLYYHKKKYFFFDHFILMLHYYAYVYFICLPFVFIPQTNMIVFVPLIFSCVYLWLFIKRFYQESTVISLLKYILFTLFSTIIIVILSILLVIGIILKETFLA